MGDEVVAATPGPQGRVGGVDAQVGRAGRLRARLRRRSASSATRSSSGPSRASTSRRTAASRSTTRCARASPTSTPPATSPRTRASSSSSGSPRACRRVSPRPTIQGKQREVVARRALHGDAPLRPRLREHRRRRADAAGRRGARRLPAAHRPHLVPKAVHQGQPPRRRAHVRREGGARTPLRPRAEAPHRHEGRHLQDQGRARSTPRSISPAGSTRTSSPRSRRSRSRATMASATVGKMKGTHAINLADLPPLPAMITRKKDGAPDAAAASVERQRLAGPAPGDRRGRRAACRRRRGRRHRRRVRRRRSSAAGHARGPARAHRGAAAVGDRRSRSRERDPAPRSARVVAARRVHDLRAGRLPPRPRQRHRHVDQQHARHHAEVAPRRRQDPHRLDRAHHPHRAHAAPTARACRPRPPRCRRPPPASRSRTSTCATAARSASASSSSST